VPLPLSFLIIAAELEWAWELAAVWVLVLASAWELAAVSESESE
jgi:hypothetical protein